MPYETLFAGIGGTVIGTLIGAYISARLTYGFQKSFLTTTPFSKQQAEADAWILRKQNT